MSPQSWSDYFAPVARSHAADRVFEQLASAILGGQLTPGAALPPERMLAEQFGVSRIIARQALHRLAEIGLVRVRQGGSTLVLDPEDCTDLRVIELVYRMGPTSAGDVLDLAERQLLQGLALLQVAGRRASRPELEALAAMVEKQAAAGGESELAAFEERFWTAVARAGKNRLYCFEVKWWFRLLADHPELVNPVLAPPQARLTALRELVRRLLAGEDAAHYYLDLITPLLSNIQTRLRRNLRRVK